MEKKTENKENNRRSSTVKMAFVAILIALIAFGIGGWIFTGGFKKLF